MAPSYSLPRARFARFVERVLNDAHDRGLTDKDIEKVTGVGSSTFHRWKRGDFRQAPELERVRAFCRGLGVSAQEALAALGITEQRDNPAPEPQMDPNIRTILRYLSDPSVPDEYKAEIGVILKMLAQRRPPRRREAS